jgi:hypothetical protein
MHLSGHRLLAGAGECSWQDDAYVLGCFGKSAANARKAYLDYVQAGLAMRGRPELVGGGLIRLLQFYGIENDPVCQYHRRYDCKQRKAI